MFTSEIARSRFRILLPTPTLPLHFLSSLIPHPSSLNPNSITGVHDILAAWLSGTLAYTVPMPPRRAVPRDAPFALKQPEHILVNYYRE